MEQNFSYRGKEPLIGILRYEVFYCLRLREDFCEPEVITAHSHLATLA